MTKTIADLAHHERADYVGMWVDVPHKPHPVVYMGDFESTGEIKYGAVIFDPRYGTNYERLDDCTLRPDLPRAWNPDGQPLEADWQYAEYRPGVNRGFYTIEETIEKGPEMAEGTTAARRWVGEWEEA